MTKRVLMVMAALVLTISLVFAACGSGDSGSGTSSGGTSGGGAGSSAGGSSSTGSGGGTDADLDWSNPIYIGFAMDFSTETGQFYIFSMNLACDELNEAGGFDGRPFEMIYENMGGADQQSYINALMKLLDRYDEMSVVVADVNTPYVLATIGNIEAAGGVAYVSGASSRSNAESGSEWVFIARTVDIYSAANLCNYVMDSGADSIGIIRMSDASGTSWTERFIEVLDTQFGKSPTAHEIFDERSETNFSPYVLKIIASGCDTIISKSGVVSEQIINSVFDNGFDGLKFNPDLNVNMLKNTGSKVEGWRATTDYNNKYRSVKPYVAWFDDLFVAEFDQPSVTAGSEYHDIVMIIAEAIRIAGTADDKAAIRDGLYEIMDLEGVMSDYSYHEVGRTFPNYQYKVIVENGEFEIVDVLMTYEINDIYVYPEGKEPANYNRSRDRDRPN
ncbi:MAG: ABC transporter substrate-binding protein [Oscillospiraceae bacterium]|nr:ABC transporter substrate-binding protein [Oscillospiraceae bacterium]